MTEQRLAELAALGVSIPPTQDELPYSDGMPMESERHVLQMQLLIETLRHRWKDRPTGYVGGDMFVYFSLEHVRNQDFRGPDFFAVLDASKKERKSWVVWEEGLGPDVVIELLSETTADADRGEKKRIYQDRLRVPEYFWYDPFGGELTGWRLSDGVYKPIKPDRAGHLRSRKLGLALERREGVYQGVEAPWLRWLDEAGELLPTQGELAEQAQLAAEQAQLAAEQAQLAAEQAQLAADRERGRAEQAEARLREVEAELRRLRADQKPDR